MPCVPAVCLLLGAGAGTLLCDDIAGHLAGRDAGTCAALAKGRFAIDAWRGARAECGAFVRLGALSGCGAVRGRWEFVSGLRGRALLVMVGGGLEAWGLGSCDGGGAREAGRSWRRAMALRKGRGKKKITIYEAEIFRISDPPYSTTERPVDCSGSAGGFWSAFDDGEKKNRCFGRSRSRRPVYSGDSWWRVFRSNSLVPRASSCTLGV